MWLVTYRGVDGEVFRNYKNFDANQVMKIANSYARRHKLIWTAIKKVY